MRKKSKIAMNLLIAVAAAAVVATAARAQDKPKTFEELINYKGADREQILYEGAKKEGVAVYYTGYVKRLMDNYMKMWKAKYPGVNLDVTIASDHATATRVITEYQAGVHAVDVISTSGTTKAISDAIGKGAFNSPVLSDYPVGDVGRAKDNSYIALTFLAHTFAFNTNRVKPDEIPTKLEDLLSPRWKGKIVVNNSPSMLPMLAGGLLQTIGEEKTRKFLKEFAKQDVTVLPVTVNALAGMVAAGDYDGCICAVHHIRALQEDGAPVQYKFLTDTVFAQTHVMQLPPKPAHPYAALLLADFLLSPTGGALVQKDTGYFPTNATLFALDKELSSRKSWVMTPELLETDGDKWRKELTDAGFVKQ